MASPGGSSPSPAVDLYLPAILTAAGFALEFHAPEPDDLVASYETAHTLISQRLAQLGASQPELDLTAFSAAISSTPPQVLPTKSGKSPNVVLRIHLHWGSCRAAAVAAQGLAHGQGAHRKLQGLRVKPVLPDELCVPSSSSRAEQAVDALWGYSAAGLLIIDGVHLDEAKCLMLSHVQPDGTVEWSLPGGKREPADHGNCFRTAAREMMEELALPVKRAPVLAEWLLQAYRDSAPGSATVWFPSAKFVAVVASVTAVEPALTCTPQALAAGLSARVAAAPDGTLLSDVAASAEWVPLPQLLTAAAATMAQSRKARGIRGAIQVAINTRQLSLRQPWGRTVKQITKHLRPSQWEDTAIPAVCREFVAQLLLAPSGLAALQHLLPAGASPPR